MANKRIQLKDVNDNVYVKLPQKNGTFTPISGTAGEIRVCQTENIVEVHFYLNRTLSAREHVVIGKISGVDMPPTYVRVLNASGDHAWDACQPLFVLLEPNGDISVEPLVRVNSLDINIVYTTNY